jgi:endo-1,4-beta-xylanase
MKNIYKIGLNIAIVAILTSCVEDEPRKFSVEKPLSIAEQEEINAYDDLKTYVGGDFKLGAGVNAATYTDQGVPYRLINRNFSEISLTNAMTHAGLVKADGSVKPDTILGFLSAAKDAGLSIYGSPLAWHANQNATFLNKTIAPVVIPASGGPQWFPVVNVDFETTENSAYEGNSGAELSFTADGQGANGTGRALKVTNSTVRANDWESQFFIKLAPTTEVGQIYKLTMDIRSDVAASYPTQAHRSPGGYKHWNFFGSMNSTTEWTSISVEITIDADRSECGAIAFNLGSTATSFYFDNIVLTRFNPDFSGPTWDLVTGTNFETSDASNYEGNSGAAFSFTADGQGANGTGRALKVTNASVRANDWESQFFIKFSPLTEVGQKYRLTMDVRSDVAASYPTQAHRAPGGYKHWNFFGSINSTTEWTSISVEITVDADRSECGAIAFNLGSTATSFYFDNIELRFYNEAGSSEEVIERTPQEKKDTLTYHLDKWIAGVMSVSKEGVKAWDVIKNPMDDTNTTELVSGEGKTLGANEFYWQDYLGKDYAVTAITLARKYGNSSDLLFVNESGMATNTAKCEGLIEYIKYIETQSVTVDGIATEMHIDINADKDAITQMFKLLAATGKKIKISELQVASATTTSTLSIAELQAEMYKFVLNTYKQEVGASQRYGVTVLGIDGLWDSKFTRMPAYAKFADALTELK